MTMLGTVVAVLTMLSAMVTGQQNCGCLPDQWRATMTDTSQVNLDVYEFRKIFIDYVQQKMAIRYFNYDSATGAVSGPTRKSVLDFSSAAMYYEIDQTGSTNGGPCKLSEFSNTLKPMRCLDSTAGVLSLGNNYMGPKGAAGLDPVDYYRFNVEGSNPTQILTLGLVTQNDGCSKYCVPVIESVAPLTDRANGVTYTFADFKPCIVNDNVFNVPNNFCPA